MRPRIDPATSPYSSVIQAALDKVMPKGVPPLTLFTTMARDERLFTRFFSGGLIDKGHLPLRERELVIHRVTALCGSEYEWGVHAAFFASKINFLELSEELFNANDLTFKTISVTSSLIPLIDVNSCNTPSI